MLEARKEPICDYVFINNTKQHPLVELSHRMMRKERKEKERRERRNESQRNQSTCVVGIRERFHDRNNPSWFSFSFSHRYQRRRQKLCRFYTKEGFMEAFQKLSVLKHIEGDVKYVIEGDVKYVIEGDVKYVIEGDVKYVIEGDVKYVIEGDVKYVEEIRHRR